MATLKSTNLLKVALVAAATLLAVCLMALVGAPRPAGATFPGGNGKIAFHGLWMEDLHTPDDDAEIFTINPDGTGLTQITDNTGIVDVAPSWSPDGATIAYTALDDTDLGTGALYTVSAAGRASGQSPTLVIEGAAEGGAPSGAAWSPDGSRIAYYSWDGTDNEIYTVSASGGTPTQVTDNTESDVTPSWSPDGTNIVYRGTSGDGFLDLYKIPVTQQGAANGLPINVTNDRATQTDPDYSPSGTEITYRLTEFNPSLTFSGIATMPIDGGVPTRLVNYSVNANNIGVPAYAPDGTKIAYSEVVGSNWQIFTVPSSGGTPTAVTDDSSIVAIGPDWQPINYIFDGFYSPVDNYPTLNVVPQPAGKANQLLRFSLGSDQGTDIFENGYPISTRVACPSESPADVVEETAAAEPSNLTYTGNGQYTYSWKTEKAWKGTCRELNLRLKDGTDHKVLFQFLR